MFEVLGTATVGLRYREMDMVTAEMVFGGSRTTVGVRDVFGARWRAPRVPAHGRIRSPGTPIISLVMAISIALVMSDE